MLKEQEKRQSKKSVEVASEQPTPEDPKPKRQYRRREVVGGGKMKSATTLKPAASTTDLPITAREAAERMAGFVEKIRNPRPAEDHFGSFGLEYIQALTRLLELLTEPSRERLVSFIIDAKII